MTRHLEVAIISGVAGQDGSYLYDQITADKDTLVFGLARSISSTEGSSLPVINLPVFIGDSTPFDPDLKAMALECDFGDENSINNTMRLINDWCRQYVCEHKLKYDSMDIKCYHFAALSHVHESYNLPLTYMNTNTLGTIRFYNAFKKMDFHETMTLLWHRFRKTHRPVDRYFYHAATTELFSGAPGTAPQTSRTPFDPQTPYAVSKLAALKMLQCFKNDGIFIRQAIISNHESTRRPMKFVTQKVVSAVRDYCLHLSCSRDKKEFKKVPIGNLNAKRDWGWAPEYVSVIRNKIMTRNCTDLITIGTGKMVSVGDFIKKTIDIAFEELPSEQRPKISDIFYVEDSYIRRNEVHELQIDTEEAFQKIGWRAKYDYEDVIRFMLLKEIPQTF